MWFTCQGHRLCSPKSAPVHRILLLTFPTFCRAIFNFRPPQSLPVKSRISFNMQYTVDFVVLSNVILPPLSVRHTFTFATPSPLLFSSGFPHPLFRTMMTGCGHPLLQLATPPSPRGFPPIARVHHRLGPTALCQGRPRGGAVSFEHLRPSLTHTPGGFLLRR